MPELNWIGKQAVRAHHREVDFHLLRDVPEMACAGWSAQSPVRNPAAGERPFRTEDCADHDGNLIVQGDNLRALKALLPRYAGQVKCIYIDPPYNTGNEGWVYNDNVKAPEIQKWLHQVVGKEAEDLSRHDKWLCMMYPRLQLLKRFLREDGSIWVSIDDNEVASLRLLMDEVFGKQNFITTVLWQKIFAPKNSARHFSEDHDYVVVYAVNADAWKPNLVPRSDEAKARYKNPDKDTRGPWTSGDLQARNYYSAGTYPITCPSGRVIEGPGKGMYWRFSIERFKELDSDGRIWWGTNGDNMPRLKRYLSDVKDGIVPQTMWFHADVGHTQEAKKEVLELVDFDSSDEVFITPKPTRLIQRILQIATDKDSLVLDSFAGSGTTGHAVLKQNAEDGGTRRFILVEMEEKIARTITAERVRRVVKRMGEEAANGAAASWSAVGSEAPHRFPSDATAEGASSAPESGVAAAALQDAGAPQLTLDLSHDGPPAEVSKHGARPPLIATIPGFRFAVLGDTLFDAEGNIRETVTFEELAEFVWFQQTGAPLPKRMKDEGGRMKKSPLLGIHRGTAVYLLFNGILGDKSASGGNVLTRPVLYALPEHDGPKAVWCAACRISELHLRRLDVTAKQIPYQLEVNAWL